MNQEFIEKIQTTLTEKTLSNKWSKKIDLFFSGFSYLNNENLILEQVEKALHIGINSLNQSSELIKILTNENLEMLQNDIKYIIETISKISLIFETLEKSINSKNNWFTFNKEETFFTIFKQQENNIKSLINELEIKKLKLPEIKKKMKEGQEQILDTYTLLERDVKLINDIIKNLEHHEKDLVRKSYATIEFELIQNKTSLLTQQQILFQKYGAISLLINNITNCDSNIKHISKTTYSIIMNTLELQNIIQFNKSKLSDFEKTSLQKLKDSIILTSIDMKLVSSSPLTQHF